MRRIDRLELLSRVIRDRPGITTGDLAREFGVSPRSIFRDLAVLRDRGLPLEAERGRGGGVRMHANWGLGKVLLNTEEALGALLTLVISEKLGFPMFETELGTARRKLVDAFPSYERRQLAPLRERVFVGPAASRAVRESLREPARTVRRPLQYAFVHARLLQARYARQDGTALERRIEPHALVINWPAWYVMGFDHLRGEPRTFRMDRFERVDITDTVFRPRPRDMAACLLNEVGGVLLQAL